MAKRTYGEGTFSTVNNRPSSPLRFRKSINGKYVSVYGKTERECIRKMKEKEAELLEKEKYTHPTDISNCALLQDAVKYWLDTYKKPTLKGKSYDRYVQIYSSFIESKTIGRTSIDNISSDDLQTLLNEASDSHSQSTVNKIHGLLKQFFDHYYRTDINHNPMLIVTKPKKQIDYSVEDASEIDDSKVLSDDEIERLTQELTRPYKNGTSGYRCGYILLFIMWAYLRYGEAVALQYKDLSVDKKSGKYVLRVSKSYNQEMNYKTGKKEWKLTTPKSKNSIRTIPLSPQAVDSIHKYIESYIPEVEADSFVFFSGQNNPISNQHLNKKLKQALQRAGISKNISIHGLRHTGISYWIRHGVDIASISRTAGHTDISTTTRIYYNIIKEQTMSMFDNVK